MAVKKLIFVDTNIWLDFYRARTEAGLSLLEHLERVSDKIIVTSQLEMEFKKNRLSAMLEGMQELKPPQPFQRPGFFSDAQHAKAIQQSQKRADASMKALRARFIRSLSSPSRSDPVYKICQRIFNKKDPLVLTREDPLRRAIRRRALRRFLLGCPPRKKNDTSMGDAFNWEWMVECAIKQKAELVIVSRDADYGMVIDDVGYPNDHLVQEFHDRVSRKRNLYLYNKASVALQHFQVKVTEKEKEEEEAIVQARPEASPAASNVAVQWPSALVAKEIRDAATAINSPALHSVLRSEYDKVREVTEIFRSPTFMTGISKEMEKMREVTEMLRSPNFLRGMNAEWEKMREIAALLKSPNFSGAISTELENFRKATAGMQQAFSTLAKPAIQPEPERPAIQPDAEKPSDEKKEP